MNLVISTFVLITLLFLPAGRWDLPWFWAFVIVVIMSKVASLFVMTRGLREERRHPGRGEADRLLNQVEFPIQSGMLILAGLDVGRFQWSPVMPSWASGLGLCAVILALSLSLWSMKVNPFFSPVVRIHADRGHYLVSRGPYHYIRHPGNLATMVLFLCSGLALGSWVAFYWFVPGVFLLIRRTLLEDRFLGKSLSGYSEYRTRTLYKMFPGVW